MAGWHAICLRAAQSDAGGAVAGRMKRFSATLRMPIAVTGTKRTLTSSGDLHMRKLQQGFTLIELMIVVAIIGILAAIAIPAYSDYTVRAKVTEAINAMASAKTAVGEFFVSNGVMPTGITTAGFSSTIGSKYVTNITYTPSGTGTGATLTVAITDTVKTGLVGQTVLLYASGLSAAVDWDCRPGTLATKYTPAECRTTGF